MPLACSMRAVRLFALILLSGACFLGPALDSRLAQAAGACPCFNTEQIVAACALPPGLLALFPESHIVHSSWDPEEYSDLTCTFVHKESVVVIASYYAGHWTTQDLSTPVFCRFESDDQTVSEHKPLTSDQLNACRQQVNDAAVALGVE